MNKHLFKRIYKKAIFSKTVKFNLELQHLTIFLYEIICLLNNGKAEKKILKEFKFFLQSNKWNSIWSIITYFIVWKIYQVHFDCYWCIILWRVKAFLIQSNTCRCYFFFSMSDKRYIFVRKLIAAKWCVVNIRNFRFYTRSNEN